MNYRLLGLVLSTAVTFVSLAAQQRATEINPKKAMAQAQTEADAGRRQEALRLYESVASSSSRDAARFKAEALYAAAILRLSPDASPTDLAGARTALQQLTNTDPRSDRRHERTALLHLLDEVDRHAAAAQGAERSLADAKTADAAARAAHQKQVDDLTIKLEAAQVELESGKGDADKARQTMAALRTENRSLRDQLAKVQTELERKDAALKKIASSIVR